jgi:segregation and condensation protein B
VQEVAGGFRLATRPEAHAWVQRLQQVKPARLSRPALETLAIVAYRQPITRAEIEKIRGVAADGVIRTLLERELIRILGRKAEAGRPIVYGTSTGFLEHFGFKELGDLPTLKEIDELLGTPPPAAAVADAAPSTAGEPADASTHTAPERDADEPAAAIESADVEPAEPPR